MSATPDANDPRVWPLLLAAWLVALVASLAVLFVGEVMGQAPCLLCWFQRAFMFPLAIVLAVACFASDARVWRYALPLAVSGGIIAGYHVLLYFDVVPQDVLRCGEGPSCSGAEMTVLGGVPLPLLSLLAFAAIGGLMILLRATDNQSGKIE